MDEESRLIRKFASFSPSAKRQVLSIALAIDTDQANIILNKLAARLQYEESLLLYTKSKSEIDLKLAREIDEIKLRKFGKRTKPAKIAKKIMLHLIEIEQLRKAGASWKDIAGYLKKNYHISASWVWVRNVFHEHFKEKEND